ncbi:MAG: dTDP-4-keto-6-deoxy-D-glucose epimerase [Castellaniella sp.]|uniref:dTDP-4-dehydrorhamnose 3,5-epimerase family protein n=1 Tax=Castellaniella sp. TaxID=1955812 RepID=UPI0011F51A02|nr:dTDP-4-dehydrorhamnose 3,5-epimerase family protein [Castellaniella sp.]TAN26613.1 MAG: dTDP-4-keto-6-deoxy-D-glucose epimerase [Castellaniella sp.]
MSRLMVTRTAIAGLFVVQRQRLGDDRGFLSRLFCAEELASAGWVKPIAQINHTSTAVKGTVRGMHFQHPPYTEMKLVTCLRGAVWDVGLDLRANSATFLQWHATELSADNGCALLIPEGCAHGFQALSDDCELLYLHSSPYAARAEGGLSATDARLAISWPLPITLQSQRDLGHPRLTADFKGLELPS